MASHRLAVYPAAIGSGQEGNDRSNVFGLAEPLQRRHLRQLVDFFL
jgi:hypothetical protein